MDRRNSSGLTGPAVIIAFLAALGLGPALTRSQIPTAAPSPVAGAISLASASRASEGYEENGGYEHGGGYLLERFLGRLGDDIYKKRAWAATQGQSALPPEKDFGCDDSRCHYTAETLIVTLPTPTSPPLRYFFDSSLAALEAAAATAGYMLDSYDLPWTSGGRDSSGRFQLGGEIDVFPSDTKNAQSQQLSRRATPQASRGPAGNESGKSSNYLFALKPNTDDDNRWRRDAGVILLRNEANHQLLLVFVVGETPTSGINKTAMRDALDQITWLHGWQGSFGRQPARHLVTLFQRAALLNEKRGNEIRIVGPTFSGSAPSLRNALEDWRHYSTLTADARKALSVKIISGTATSVGNDALTLTDGPKELPRVTFNTVQIPDKILSKKIPDLLEHVDDVDVPGSPPRSNLVNRAAARVASIFATLANLTRTKTPSSVTSTPAHPHIAMLSENTTYGAAYGNDDGGRMLTLSFPLHISQLRGALKSEDHASPQATLGRRDLDLPDESGQQRRDVITPFSPRAAMYDELALNNLLNTIRRERIRYVGIVATDVEDLVFLAQQIRTYCPDVVIFTTANDLRFLHTEVNTELRGTLTFATYPLFGEIQRWTSPFPMTTLHTFPSDSAHGVYDAVLAQLDMPEQMLDYGQPFGRALNPVVQIGVVGREDIWPLAFWSPEDSKFEGTQVLKRSAQTTTLPLVLDGHTLYPPAFQVLFVTLNIFFAIVALTLLMTDLSRWARMPMSARLIGLCEKKWWLAVLRKDPQPQLWEARHAFAMSAFAGMFIAEIVGLGFLRIPIRIAPELQHARLSLSFSLTIVWIFAYSVGVLVLVASVVSVLRMFSGWRNRRGWIEFLRPPAYVTIALISVILALVFVLDVWSVPSPAQELFTFIRAVHLHDGVSPLMALTFLGIAGVALVACYFFRVAMLEDRPLRSLLLPVGGESASFRGIRSLQKEVVRVLERAPMKSSQTWLSAQVLIGFLVVSFLYFGITKLGVAFSIDGETFDIFFIFVGFMIYAMFSAALLRFALGWLALRRLLRRLYFHPSRYTYKNFQLVAQPSHLEHQRIMLHDPRPGLGALEYALGCARNILWMARLTTGYSELSRPVVFGQRLEPALREAEGRLEELHQATNWSACIAARKGLYERIANLTVVVTELFEPIWRMSVLTPHLHAIDDQTKAIDEKATPDRMLLQQAELFVAANMVDFIRHVMPHLFNLVGFAMPAVLAMVLAVSVYPFPAHDTLLWASWTVLLATIALTLYVFVGINRNPILSMITGTDPGQFNWDSAFTVHLLLFAVIPVLTLLGAQYPHALSGAISWIGSIFGGAKT